MFHKAEFNFLKYDNTSHLVKCKIKRWLDCWDQSWESLRNWSRPVEHRHGVSETGGSSSWTLTPAPAPTVEGASVRAWMTGARPRRQRLPRTNSTLVNRKLHESWAAVSETSGPPVASIGGRLAGDILPYTSSDAPPWVWGSFLRTDHSQKPPWVTDSTSASGTAVGDSPLWGCEKINVTNIPLKYVPGEAEVLIPKGRWLQHPFPWRGDFWRRGQVWAMWFTEGRGHADPTLVQDVFVNCFFAEV